MSDCAGEGCDFPETPGLPSQDYRCPDPVAGYDDCVIPCTVTLGDDQLSCAEDLALCLDGATSEEAEACLNTECSCRSIAQQAFEGCRTQCDVDFTFPAAMACARAEVEADQTCCDTELAECYAPCEDDYLDAAEPIEEAYFECVQATSAAYFGYYAYLTDGEIPVCDGLNEPSFLPCERTRLVAMIEITRARSICRATCEKVEYARENLPEDRKYKECGGRYHLCQETCKADFRAEVDAISATFYDCAEACQGEVDEDAIAACVEPCNTAYRDAYAELAIENGTCVLDCCKQEYDYAANHHELADCRFECYHDRIRGETDCYDAYTVCVREAGDYSEALAACYTAWCGCDLAWFGPYESCMANCRQENKGDCPNCFDDVASGFDAGDDVGYSAEGGSVPTSGVGQRPTECF